MKRGGPDSPRLERMSRVFEELPNARADLCGAACGMGILEDCSRRQTSGQITAASVREIESALSAIAANGNARLRSLALLSPDADGACLTVESIIGEAMKAAKVIWALSPAKNAGPAATLNVSIDHRAPAGNTEWQWPPTSDSLLQAERVCI